MPLGAIREPIIGSTIKRAFSIIRISPSFPPSSARMRTFGGKASIGQVNRDPCLCSASNFGGGIAAGYPRVAIAVKKES